MTMPRTLLLTLWPPDAKYKILRRYAEKLPDGSLFWCSLQECESGNGGSLPFKHASVVPASLHWRLRDTWCGYLYRHELRAAGLARSLAGRVGTFRPEVLWVLPELGAARVGYHLCRSLGVPLHLTSHDAHETARTIVPPLYYPFYERSVNRIFRAADSVDAVSEGLLDHLGTLYPNVGPANGIVFHPSIDAALVMPDPEPRDRSRSPLRRIGICGSMRVSEEQWREFLEMLSGLPYEFEIVSCAYRDRYFDAALPANVRQVPLPFAPTESDVIAAFRENGVDACYLGLWKKAGHGLFGRTSLSAKLVTYAAAALPVIVDAREDSVAWQLAKRHGAGVCVSGSNPRGELERLFGDDDAWHCMAAGARALCLNEFDLDTNVARFVERLNATTSQRRAG